MSIIVVLFKDYKTSICCYSTTPGRTITNLVLVSISLLMATYRLTHKLSLHESLNNCITLIFNGIFSQIYIHFLLTKDNLLKKYSILTKRCFTIKLTFFFYSLMLFSQNQHKGF